jgi:hypothetical protein
MRWDGTSIDASSRSWSSACTTPNGTCRLGARGVRGEQDERRPRLPGRHERGDGVRRAGALRDDAHRDVPGDPGVPVGHGDRARLVPRAVEGDPELVGQPADHPQGARPEQPERASDSLGPELLGDLIADLEHVQPPKV